MTPDGESDDSPLVLASPVYLVSPMPAHMMFPGSLPVPATTPVEPALPVLGTLESANVAVVDTPFVEPGDQPASVDDPWTHGHSTFIGSVIAASGGGELSVVYENPLTRADARGQKGNSDVPYIDEVQFGESLRLAASGRKKGVNRVVNLSLGVYPCTVDPQATTVDPDDKGALTLFPVTTVRRLPSCPGHSSRARGSWPLVAAAGNAPEATVTLPAALANVDALLRSRVLNAFSVPAQRHFATSSAESKGIVDRALELRRPWCLRRRPTSGSRRTRHQSSNVPYSTEGPWMTTRAEGCHVGAYPGGSFHYPEGPGGENAGTVQLGDSVYWCGTSFAAPVISTLVARQLASGLPAESGKSRVETIKGALPGP